MNLTTELLILVAVFLLLISFAFLALWRIENYLENESLNDSIRLPLQLIPEMKLKKED